MKLEELINSRILIKGTQRYGDSGIAEVKVLEVSPSGNWVKIMNINGNKYWKAVSDIALVEVLKDLRTGENLT